LTYHDSCFAEAALGEDPDPVMVAAGVELEVLVMVTTVVLTVAAGCVAIALGSMFWPTWLQKDKNHVCNP
jgi:hypothetical protein